MCLMFARRGDNFCFVGQGTKLPFTLEGDTLSFTTQVSMPLLTRQAETKDPCGIAFQQ